MSLNEGFELDDELEQQGQERAATLATDNGFDQIRDHVARSIAVIQPDEFAETVFETVVPGEVPELDEDTNLVSVVAAAGDLDYLQADIVKADGMSKTFALEAEKLIPGFINENRPLVFFTDFPSKTNYKAALEAIEEERKSILQRIWDAIMAFMRKAGEWLDKLLVGLQNLRGKAEKAAEVFDEASTFAAQLEGPQKGLDDPKNVISKVALVVKDKQSPGYQNYIGGLEEGLESYQKKFQTLYRRINRDDALYAIVSKSSVVPTLIALGKNADEIVHDYSDIDRRWLETLLLDKNNEDLGERDTEYAVKRVMAPATKQRLSSFRTYAQSVELSMKQRMGEYDQSNKPLKELLKIVATTIKSREMLQMDESISTATQKFKALQKTMVEFTSSSDWINREVRAQKLTNVNQVFRTLHEELHGIISLMSHAGKIYAAWVWMGDALKEAVEDYRRYTTAKTSGLSPEDKDNVFKYFGIQPEGA